MSRPESSCRSLIRLLTVLGTTCLILALICPAGCKRFLGPTTSRTAGAPPTANNPPQPAPARNPVAVGTTGQRPVQTRGSKPSPEDDPRIPQMKISKERLRQLAQAMRSYNDAQGSFPPQAVLLPDGTPGLSWRVLLLPYLGQGDLYRQFNQREPWDGPTNRPLLAKMPEVYRPVVGAVGDGTYYQIFVGPGAAFEPPGQSRNRAVPGVRLAEFGAFSTTLLLIEGGDTVPWTKPQDLVYNPTGPLPKIGGQFGDRAWATTVDGATQCVSANAPESLLRLAITRNPEQPFNFADLGPR